MGWKHDFEHPPAGARGAPFWAWNCKMDRRLLEEQIPYFKKMGMGGFTIHSRTGLDTPYLGKEFMDCVRICVEKAKQEGLQVHLYDEDRWPSGFGGGYVTAEEQYRARYLVFSRWPDGKMPDTVAFKPNGRLDIRPHGGGRLLLAVRVEEEEGYLKEYHIVDGQERGDRIWYLHEEVMQTDPWFNNQTYMDTLNPDAVQKQLDVTYEAYDRNFSGEFGTNVISMFTDEPQFVHKHVFSPKDQERWAVLPYTEGFDKLFEQTFHKKFLERIPELLWDKRDTCDLIIRYGYHRLLLERFASVYCDRLGQWCKEHGLKLTGHMKGEGTLALQSGSLGEAMRNYKGFQIPGIDILCDKREYVTAKQAQSVSRQMGRNEVTSELYGVTNWDFDFKHHKLQGDWQAALGVTHRVPHLSWASMEGETKRDFPASIFYQSPWYEAYEPLESYFARIHGVMTAGHPVVSLGVIHPIESYWLYDGGGEGGSEKRELLEQQFQTLCRWLLSDLVDFDYISEALLEEQETDVDGQGLFVGKMCYHMILVPGLCQLRSHTLSLLEQFHQAGGILIFMGHIPDYVDGKRDRRAWQLASHALSISFDRMELRRQLDCIREVELWELSSRNLSWEEMMAEREKTETTETTEVTGTVPYLYQMRADDKGKYLFLANGGRCEDWDGAEGRLLCVAVKGTYDVRCFNPIDGTDKEVKAGYDYRNGSWRTLLKTELFAQDSLLLALENCDCPQSNVELDESGNAVQECIRKPELFPASCQYRQVKQVDITYLELQEPNVLLLDQARFCLDGGCVESREEVLRIENIVRGRIGYPFKTERFAQPWTEAEEEIPCHQIELWFSFSVRQPCGELTLAIERPEEKEIRWNGRLVEEGETGEETDYYVDRSIRKRKLGKAAAGDHELYIRMPFTRKSSLEWCYILGDFAVDFCGMIPYITGMACGAAYGTITRLGMPFYGGNVRYHAELDVEEGEYMLEAGLFAAPLLQVEIDGMCIGTIAYAPYRLPLGRLKGRHEMCMISYGNRHNTFGALHNCKKEETWFGPSAWRTVGAEYTYGYEVKDAGILKAPVLYRLVPSDDTF